MVVKKSVFRPWEMNKWIEDTAAELIRKYTRYGFKMDYVLKSKWCRNHCQYRVSSKRKFLHSRIKKLNTAKDTGDYFRSHVKFFGVSFFPISPENKLTCERYFLFLLRLFLECLDVVCIRLPKLFLECLDVVCIRPPKLFPVHRSTYHSTLYSLRDCQTYKINHK